MSLKQRLKKLEKDAPRPDEVIYLKVHSGTIATTGRELDRILKEINGKTRTM